MPEQVLEDFELLHRQLECLSRPAYLARDEIHLEVVLPELQDLVRATAAQERADAREEFRERERLHEIIIGPAVEPTHAIVDGVLRGEDQDRGLQPAFAQRRQDLDPIAMGEHEIEHDAIEGLVVHEEEPFLPRGRDADVVVLRLEPLPERFRDLLFVLDDRDAHRTRHYIDSSAASHLTRMSGTRQWRVMVDAVMI